MRGGDGVQKSVETVGYQAHDADGPLGNAGGSRERASPRGAASLNADKRYISV